LESEFSFLDAYWVSPGRIMAGEYPGVEEPEYTGPRVRLLLEAGVSVFIDLTVRDKLEPYLKVLTQEADRLGSEPEYQKRPIRDVSTPTVEEMTEILDSIDESVDAGKVVYLHCAAGLGRTGVVVGCCLVRHGMSGTEALEEIPRLRRRDLPGDSMVSPYTQGQRSMVMGWSHASQRSQAGTEENG
jgi:protein-tyrosine phosphatase